MTIIYQLNGNEIFRVSEVGALWQADKKFYEKFGHWPEKETTLVTIIHRN